MNVFDILKQRGYIKQTTHEDEIKKLLSKEGVKFYIGFDPTAESLHIGHFIQLMVIKHMMNASHVPILLIGGGTAYVGDPSGRTDMRTMMDADTIKKNGEKFVKLFERFIDTDKAIVANNADWLLDVNYVDFIRDIGKHFSVNKMLSAECFKSRMESGLSFLEFNYMLMQSYDFLMLKEKYNCEMQLGGDDQWSNIIGGVELVRKKIGEQVFGMTFALLENKQGVKMGKTAKGALWLDETKTSPFDFYQYFRNIDDADVEKCLKLLTFMDLDEIEKIVMGDINLAKQTLAFEITKIVHGEEKAIKAKEAAKALFEGGGDSEFVPTTKIAKSDFEGDGFGLASLMTKVGLTKSNGEAMRAIDQGGVMIDSNKISDKKFMVTLDIFAENKITIKKGKKTFHVVELG